MGPELIDSTFVTLRWIPYRATDPCVQDATKSRQGEDTVDSSDLKPSMYMILSFQGVSAQSSRWHPVHSLCRALDVKS